MVVWEECLDRYHKHDTHGPGPGHGHGHGHGQRRANAVSPYETTQNLHDMHDTLGHGHGPGLGPGHGHGKIRYFRLFFSGLLIKMVMQILLGEIYEKNMVAFIVFRYNGVF